MPNNENNIVKRTIELNKAPVVSAKQKSLLAALATLPDTEIDYSDAPVLPNAMWMKAAALPNT